MNGCDAHRYASVEPNTSFFSIELMKSDGNNLIEHHTYNKSKYEIT